MSESLRIDVQEHLEERGLPNGIHDLLAGGQALAEPSIQAYSHFLNRSLSTDSDDVTSLRMANSWLIMNVEETAAVYDEVGLIVDPETAFRGLKRLYEVFDSVDMERSYLLESPDRVKRVAERLLEKDAFDIANSEYEQFCEDFAEQELTVQVALLPELKQKTMEFAVQFGASLNPKHGSEESIQLDWENLWSQQNYVELFNNTAYSIEAAIDLVAVTEARHSFVSVLEKMSPIDLEEVEKNRLRYGAKGAQLLLLKSRISEAWQRGLRDTEISSSNVSIPPFTLVDTDLYRSWQAGQNIDDRLHVLYEWAQGLRDRHEEEPDGYIVRSSAVYSEDGEEMTGAGIYESIFVEPDSSFEVFKAAIEAVYESTNSESALQYRAANGITEKEAMGLVLQQYVWPAEKRGRGYVNTQLAYRPELMEIVFNYEDGTTNRHFGKRDVLAQHIGLNSFALNRLYTMPKLLTFPVDINKTSPSMIEREVQTSMLIEALMGHPVQIEYARGSSVDLSIVQVRPIPHSLYEERSVEFPNEDHIHEGAAVGVGDQTLEVLHGNNNEGKKGIVFFTHNQEWTYNGRIEALPKEGAVVILWSAGKNGHIQTLCTEKGLLCIFNDGARDGSPQFRNLSDTMASKKLRVVCDGIKGRIYIAAESEREGI